MAVKPFRVKTMAVIDFYFHKDEGYRFPLGNLPLLGKSQVGMLTANQHWVPKPILEAFANRAKPNKVTDTFVNIFPTNKADHLCPI
jgi:hypothetical protein